MSQSGFSHQGAFNFNNSPAKQQLLGCKLLLQEIQRQLKPPADLRNISENDINRFIADLNNVLIEVDNLRNVPDISNSIHSVDAVIEKIREETLVELYTASSIRAGGTDAESTRDFFKCLIKCSKYLDEALQQFLI